MVSGSGHLNTADPRGLLQEGCVEPSTLDL